MLNAFGSSRSSLRIEDAGRATAWYGVAVSKRPSRPIGIGLLNGLAMKAVGRTARPGAGLKEELRFHLYLSAHLLPQYR